MISESYIRLLEYMKKIHKEKNEAYTGKDGNDPWANFRDSERVNVKPHVGILIRMSDKFNRIRNLIKNPEVANNEPITDTLLDLASYSLICLLLYCEENNLDIDNIIREEDLQEYFSIAGDDGSTGTINTGDMNVSYR